MPQPTASQNSVSNNTSDWSGSTASLFTRIQLFFSTTGVALGITRHDPSQQQPDDSSSITSSELDDRDSNLQIERNQQHTFDGYSTGSSARSSIRSHGSGTSGSPGEQETGHDTTEYNDHDATLATDHNETHNRVYGERRIIRRYNRSQRNDNQDNNENLVLTSATRMIGFTGGIQVISNWIRNLAYNLACFFARRDGLSVYETTLVFFDRLKRLTAILLLSH